MQKFAPGAFLFSREVNEAMDKIVARAYSAWFRSGANIQPANTSGLVTYDGKDYVVLENNGGVLAVYRVRTPDGRLRRMKRPPKAILEGRN